MTDCFDLAAADLPDTSRANDEALRFIGDFLRARSSKNFDATLRFFSRDLLKNASATGL